MSRTVRIALLAGALTLAGVVPALAQVDVNLGPLTPENVKGYLAPLPKALSVTLNSAAFQTANVPMAGLNFSIGIHVMAMAFKDDDRTYSPTDPPGFTSTAPVAAPTVVGDEQAVTQPGQGGLTMVYPGGLDLKQFEIAVPQVTVGSVFGTKLMGRWIEVNTGDSELGKAKLWGVGAQHNLSHYMSESPVDVSIGAMYQGFQLGDDKLIDSKTWHAEVTASRNVLPWLQPYVAMGYDSFKMEVNYDQDLSGGGTQPTNVKFDDENNAHVTAGVLLGFPTIKLHAQVDFASRVGAAAGVRFGFGS
jgi:hypothetical protein